MQQHTMRDPMQPMHHKGRLPHHALHAGRRKPLKMAAAFDPETYQQQLEECLALKSIYEDDYSIVSGAGLPADAELDPELLLGAGPPETPVSLTVEILVDVEVPPAGVQLRLAATAGRGSAGSRAEAASSSSSPAAAAAAAAAAAEVSRLIGGMPCTSAAAAAGGAGAAHPTAAAAAAAAAAASVGEGAAGGELKYESAGDPVRI
jgi:hypothetical protein